MANLYEAPPPPARPPARFAKAPPSLPLDQPQRAVTFRSVLLGLSGVLIICGLTFYNDMALANTFLVGNNLPIGVLLLAFLFVVFVNGPLSRWKPAWAFTGGELCVAFSMTLVSCCLPSSGLMRYFPPSLALTVQQAQTNAEFRKIFMGLQVPDWLFPTFPSSDRSTWFADPIVTGYDGRWVGQGMPPYLAWLKPALAWGVFFGALYGALMCIVLIVRRQWIENERLAFPLAQIQLSLIAPPRPGSWLNTTMQKRSFWIAFVAIFLLHAWNALSVYFPKFYPAIPIKFDFLSLLSNPPWNHTDTGLRQARIYFTALGVTFFLSTPVAFSLWAFFILFECYKMYLGMVTGDAGTPGQADEHFGGLVAFMLFVAWAGRRHWISVIKQAVRGRRANEPPDPYVSLAGAARALVVCIIVMIGWLVAAGCGVGGAIVMVLTMMLLFTSIMRIIAEVGLVHGQISVGMNKLFTWAVFYGWQKPVSIETFFHSGIAQATHYDFREILPVYASHSLKLADETTTQSDRRDRRRLLWCFVLALVVGYFVSFYAALYTEYKYATTLDKTATAPLDSWSARDNPKSQIVEATVTYSKGKYNWNYDPLQHFTFGFIFTGVLSFLRMRYQGWPLHPIGFLMMNTFPSHQLWFSIFLGWMLKVILVRFGGSKMYADSRPFFLGMIIGEAMAAGFWLMMGILLSSLGLSYEAVRIMPG